MIVLVSGGVDSSVCVALVRQALPAEKIFAVHVDHGFMRKDESAQVGRVVIWKQCSVRTCACVVFDAYTFGGP